MHRIATLMLAGGAVIGNVSLLYGLLSRPRNGTALWLGMAAYLVATIAWLARTRGPTDQ